MTRLHFLLSFCWLGIAMMVSNSTYNGFEWSTFFGIGIIPQIFIFVLVWTISGFRKQKSGAPGNSPPQFQDPNSSFSAGKSTFNWKLDLRNFNSNFGRIIGISVGMIVGRALGSNMIIPCIGFLGSHYLLKKMKLGQKNSSHELTAACILFGHFLWIFVGFLNAGIRHTRTMVNTPKGNSVIERFFRSLKEECVWQQKFHNFEQAKDAVDQWVAHYNQQRPHQTLGYEPPAKYYERSVQKLAEKVS